MADNYDSPPAPSRPKTLYRRAGDKVLAGVCGGLADYFDIDPTIVRVLWVFFSFFYLLGVILYIILAIVLPVESFADDARRPEDSGGPGFG